MFDPLALVRGAAILSGAIVVGSGFLLWLLRDSLTIEGGATWRRRIALMLAAAAAAGFVATILFTIGTAAGAADVSAFSVDSAVLNTFLTKTWAGGVTLVQLGFALAAGVLCGLAWFTLEKKPASDRFLLLAAVAAGLGLCAGAFASHPTSIEPAAAGIGAAIAHRVAMSLWLGGLPALILLIGLTPVADDARRLSPLVLRRFSVLATAAMLVIAVSGTVLTWYLVGNFASAIGTAYGHLLIVKLLLLGGVLLIASSLQRRLLPALEMKPSDSILLSYAKRVKIETVLAVLIVAAAAGLAQQNPPEHEDIYWPLPFRFSIAATWVVPWVPTMVLGGAALTALGLVLIAFVLRPSLRPARLTLTPRHSLIAGVAAALVGPALALPAISVQAYPDSYLTTDIPYGAQSIADGLRHVEANCTQCHGVSGLGNGPLAKSLPKPPADFSAPHTALHTGGDLYWWVTHGIQPSGMPGFADALSNDQRWNIINFLRAFSVGYQARVISPKVFPGQSWLGPPDFPVTDQQGVTRSMRDYRGKSALLLVVGPGDAQDKARLEQLLAAKERLGELGAQIVLLAPGPATSGAAGSPPIEPLRDLAAGKILTVDQDQADALATFGLFTRTFADAKVDVARVPIEHAEFLIDPSGYIRARWIPNQETGPESWSDIAVLEQQLKTINKEPIIAPPLDEHH
jgi:putative copper resistance protein D